MKRKILTKIIAVLMILFMVAPTLATVIYSLIVG